MLIDQDGKSLGVVDTNKALDMAYDADLDLVCVAPQAQPPVCKILNYSKFRYEKEKKEKEAIKNQKVVDTKEVQLSPVIAEHDFETKLNQAKKFLQHGDKVKVTLRIKRRFQTLIDQAVKNVDDFVEKLSEFGQTDKKPEFDGKLIQVTVSPKKVSAKKQNKPKDATAEAEAPMAEPTNNEE
jgi:translation initiation factor IF-3